MKRFKCMPINDLFPEEQAKNYTLAYHYTNKKALKSILNERKIWLIHYKHLNDTNEGKEIIYKFLKLIREKPNSNKIYEKAKEIHKTAIKNFYIASFTDFGNRLSMW